MASTHVNHTEIDVTPPAVADSGRRSGPPLPLTRASVVTALETIAPLVHRTPALTSTSLSASLPGKNILYFKAENMQKGGAFKFRGASYSLACLAPEELAKGVCTHSSGACDLSVSSISVRSGWFGYREIESRIGVRVKLDARVLGP